VAALSTAHAADSLIAASEGIDTLSAVLQAVRLNGALFFMIDASSPWEAEVPSGLSLSPVLLPNVQHLISYHLITAGGCWCSLPGQPPSHLRAGDMIVIPHGDPYLLSSGPKPYAASPPEPGLSFFKQMAGRMLPRVLTQVGGGQQRLQIACGFLGCDLLPFNPVLATLPSLIHIRRAESYPEDRLSGLVDFALAESLDRRAGSDCVLLRISELMFIEVVRRYLATLSAEQRGWLAGLRDPLIGKALALLHRDPASAWTLEQLARDTGVSRSVLAARFSHFVGEPPMHYLTRWRMQLAARLLVDGTPKISAVAQQVGYDSEAAFSRAFKKAVGFSPATWRSRQAHACSRSAGGR
jgi:AraC-like DNA-binding protein